MSAFMVSQRTLDQATTAMFHGCDMVACEDFDKLAREMYRLNRDAVDDCYSHRGGSGVTDEEIDALTCDRKFSVSKVGLLKSLQCLIYQCSEGNVPESDLYKRMEEKARDLAVSIVYDLPEYKSEPWN